MAREHRADTRGEQHGNAKEPSMKLKDWELTIQQMIEEFNSEPKESGKQKRLMGWREKLAQEPYLLQLYQIDEIVREVRKRLKSDVSQSSNSPQVRVATTVASIQLTS
jgi:hypothetical protein